MFHSCGPQTAHVLKDNNFIGYKYGHFMSIRTKNVHAAKKCPYGHFMSKIWLTFSTYPPYRILSGLYLLSFITSLKDI